MGIGNTYTFALGGNDHDFFANFDSVVKTEDPRKHDFGAVGDGVDGCVFHDDSLPRNQKSFDWVDNGAKVRFVSSKIKIICGMIH